MPEPKYEFISDFHKEIIESKYCHIVDGKRETFQEAITRLAINVNKYDTKSGDMIEKTIQYISNKDFSPAGGPWRAAGNPTHKISAVNCTTQEPVNDSIGDIFESIKWWSIIASYGQGNGIDISGLRPRGARTNNCAKSSTGAVSFLTCYDASMQVIGAENRRGATKPDIWIYHPDSEEYTSCKKDPTKLTSQNISVKVDDAFMEAEEKDEEIEQRWERKNGNIYVGGRLFLTNSPGPDIAFVRTIKAKDLFDKIAQAAWATGDPGLEFWSTSERFSNSNQHPNKAYHIVSTNGCSEQKLDALNTCILSSLNLYNMPMWTEQWEAWLREMVAFGIRFLDNVILMEYAEDRSPHPQQKEKLLSMPRIGLGYTGLADWFIKNKIVYGSKKSLEVAEKIMAVFAEEAYKTSIALGKERGSFREFNQEWYTQSPFVQQLCKLTNLKLEDFTHMRHVCCLSTAPTGTLSMVVSAGGSGAENLYLPSMIRKERAVTGEYREHIIYDTCVMNECKRRGIELTRENVEHMIKDNEWVFMNDLDAMKKIDLMSVLYKYTDSGISITYNLPKDATVNDVKKIYRYGWKKGLKSITVFRDGCKAGILQSLTTNEKITKVEGAKRPKELPCDIQHLIVKGKEWIVLVGVLDEQPYEVFAGLKSGTDISRTHKQAKIVRKGRGEYTLELPDETKINIVKAFDYTDSESAISRMISISLRHGVDAKYIVQQLEKSEGDVASFSKAIARVLKKYVADGTEVTGEVCGTCGSANLRRESGCVTCSTCGWSKC